jgi:hypothetical protein
MNRYWLLLVAAVALLITGCEDSTAPRDVIPPVAPRGLYSVTGDHEVYLFWLANTEGDVAGYRVRMAPCESGDLCPYELVATIAPSSDPSYTVTGLTNGVTRYFAVEAFDRAGNRGAMSGETVYDTPRPEDTGMTLLDNTSTEDSGYDFSAYGTPSARLPWDASETDIYYVRSGSNRLMYVPYFTTAPHFDTFIQDAGYHTSLDAVDFAPNTGWSPTGTVELIVGHCYVVWTHEDRYAKFRVRALNDYVVGPSDVTFDWAYQTAAGIRELQVRPAVNEDGAARRAAMPGPRMTRR